MLTIIYKKPSCNKAMAICLNTSEVLYHPHISANCSMCKFVYLIIVTMHAPGSNPCHQ